MTPMAGLWTELKRRRVIRVGLVYVAAGWFLIEVAETTFEHLDLPDWTVTFVILLIAVGFPLTLILAWALEISPEGIRRTPKAEPTAPEFSSDESLPPGVAVLPFADMSPDQDQGYFCDGMAEEILDALAHVGHLRVPARTASFRFRDAGDDIQSIGRKLGVPVVLEGSVRKSGNQLRVTAQLIDAANGYHLWSESFDRSLEDVFAIQSEIACKVVQACQVTLSPSEEHELEKTPTVNVQAYDRYLRGRQFIYLYTRKAIAESNRLFKEACDMDPDFALAYCGLAYSNATAYHFLDHSEEKLRLAVENSERALELAPDLAEAHLARAMALSEQDNPDAIREFKNAIRLDPRLYDAYYYYGRERFHRGDFEKAIELFNETTRLEPDNYLGYSMLNTAYHAQGLGGLATESARRSVELIKQHLEVTPDDLRAIVLGATDLVEIGEEDEAKTWAERALAMSPEESSVLYNVACVYAVTGQTDKAMDVLEKAVVAGYAGMDWLTHDSQLDNLRELPRFAALLESLD